MQIFTRNSLTVIAVSTLIAIGSSALAADVDINVHLPNVYQAPAPVYVQPQPIYVTPRPVIVQQPVMVEREDQDNRYWNCKKDKCKYKKFKKEKHGKHHGHHDDED